MTPRVLQACDRAPRKLVKPEGKPQRKEVHKEELCAYYECIIERYRQAGWEIIFPGHQKSIPQQGRWEAMEPSLETDTAEFIPVHEKQSNNRGELHAAVRALQGRTPGKQPLICPNSRLVVDGALGKHKSGIDIGGWSQVGQ